MQRTSGTGERAKGGLRERRRLSLALTALVFAGAALLQLTASAARAALRVRADTEFVNLGSIPSSTNVEVSGGLRDDAGHAIADAAISLPLGAESARPVTCRPGESLRVANGAVILRTDSLGFFCVRMPATEPMEGREVRYDGDAYHEGTSAKIPAATGKRRVALEFEAKELFASLDSPSFVVWVTTRDIAGGSTGDPVRLVLFQRATPDATQESELAVTDVQLGSTARFDIETRLLGGPGSGMLIARFAGTGQLAPTVETALLARRVTARLSLAAQPPPADPSDGIELSVGVSSALGAVSEGWVEAVAGGSSVALAPVSGGAARLLATFGAPRGKPAQIMLRYVPAGDGFVAEPPLLVEVPARQQNPWSGTPWLLGVAAVAYWVVRAWRRPSRKATKSALRGEAPAGRALVELLSTDLSRSGWKGHVLDAHDGVAIAGARVSMVVPVFDGEGVAAAQTTGPDGSFSLVHVEAARNDGARLVVTAPHHTTLTEPAPADGTLAIALVSRRRTLVDRLVAWAKSAGRPWGRGREPTPLELADAARRHNQPDVEGWAAAVAEAAYGPAAPDERRESDILGREPPLPGPRDER